MRNPPEHSCAGKYQYATWAQARNACRQLRNKDQGVCHPYRCRFCRKFHVGHVRIWKKAV